MAQDYSEIPVLDSQTPREPFMRKHWRGGYSLATGVWIFGLLITIVRLAIDLGIMMALYVAFGARGQGLIISLLLMATVDALVAVWQVVGVWRSASNSITKGGARSIAVLATAFVLVIVLFSVSLVIGNVSSGVDTLSRRY